MKTDDELKQLLAKMLPEQIRQIGSAIVWLDTDCEEVNDSELLHVCWLIEQTITDGDYNVIYLTALCDYAHIRSRSASWQQRTMALAQVKGLL